MIVPVNAVPVCDTEICPIVAVRLVAPLTPRPCPDCDMAAVPEKPLWPWVDTVVTVQVPAIFKGGVLGAPLHPVREIRMGRINIEAIVPCNLIAGNLSRARERMR